MSAFDKDLHLKFLGYYWNFGYRNKGIIKMDGWVRIWKFYFAMPMKIDWMR